MLYMDSVENVFDRVENITYLMIDDLDLQENLMYLSEHQEDGEWLSVRSDISEAVNSYANREEYFNAFLLVTDVSVFGFGNENIGINDDLKAYIEMVEDANGQMRLISGEQQLTLVREVLGKRYEVLLTVLFHDASVVKEDDRIERTGIYSR